MSTAGSGTSPSIMEDVVGRGGKLVALEGNHDIVATQLRLLPPSRKILILPAISGQVDELADSSVDFQARLFVKQVHKVFAERTAQATSFLAKSKEGQPRLVFTHGGSISARTFCIARIAENMDGDVIKAEEAYNELVKDGVSGLVKDESTAQVEVPADSTGEVPQEDDGIESDDPSLRAMKAAEALDLEAGNLDLDEPVDYSAEALHGDRVVSYIEDPRKEDLEESRIPTNQHQKKKLPMRKTAANKHEIIFTAAHGEEIRRTTIVVPQRSSSLWHRRNTLGTEKPQLSKRASHRSSRRLSGRLYAYSSDDDYDLSSAGDETFPTTPGVEYGEACLVDMQSPNSEVPVRKSRSVDRFFPSLFQDPQQSMYPQVLKHSVSHSQLRTNVAKPVEEESNYFPTLPRTTFVKASQTTIRKSPSGSEASGSSASSFRTACRIFVDRGTDAEDVSLHTRAGQITSPETSAKFEEVFPLLEDLVIYFDSQESDGLLKKAMSKYPDFPLSRREGSKTNVNKSVKHYSESDMQGRQVENPVHHDTEIKAMPSSRESSQKSRVDSAIQVEAYTPGLSPISQRFAEPTVKLPCKRSDTALDLQNSLRHALGVFFPTDEGYSQHFFAVIPDLERLWKPVFRTDGSGSSGERGRTVDQIIALGCEAGVKVDFFTQISGYIERLGTKKSGLSRSGKVDIRYFISNVMQDPNASCNPLSDPETLAASLVPQLEAYLASNSSTRLLILTYTTDYLATILAMKRLLGSEVLKVAGVLDTLSSDPLSSRPRTPISPNTHPLPNEATISRPTSRRQHSLQQQLSGSTTPLPSSPKSTKSPARLSHPVSFSRADFLIPSTATDTEIATFLSSIWKCLMQRSAFYTPEPEPKPVVIHAPPIPATPRLPTSKSSTHKEATPSINTTTTAASIHSSRVLERSTNAEMSYPPSSFKSPKSPLNPSPPLPAAGNTTNDKTARLTGSSTVSTPNLNRKYAASIASSVRTTASERGRREDRAWENFYIAEEDSEDDEYDKMILGRGFAKIVPEVRRAVGGDGENGDGTGGGTPGGQKRGTKKALKWLGLA